MEWHVMGERHPWKGVWSLHVSAHHRPILRQCGRGRVRGPRGKRRRCSRSAADRGDVVSEPACWVPPCGRLGRSAGISYPVAREREGRLCDNRDRIAVEGRRNLHVDFRGEVVGRRLPRARRQRQRQGRMDALHDHIARRGRGHVDRHGRLVGQPRRYWQQGVRRRPRHVLRLDRKQLCLDGARPRPAPDDSWCKVRAAHRQFRAHGGREVRGRQLARLLRCAHALHDRRESDIWRHHRGRLRRSGGGVLPLRPLHGSGAGPLQRLGSVVSAAGRQHRRPGGAELLGAAWLQHDERDGGARLSGGRRGDILHARRLHPGRLGDG